MTSQQKDPKQDSSTSRSTVLMKCTSHSRTHLINRDGCVAGDLALQQGARRENILYGSLSDEQRRRSVKDPATLGAEVWRAAGGVAPQLSRRVGTVMLLRRALPAARQNSARLVPIYEMG